MSLATAAARSAILGVSAYNPHEYVQFISSVIALMSIKQPNHSYTAFQEMSQSLIANSGELNWTDDTFLRIHRAGKPSPSLLAMPQLHNQASSC